jgi:hypothetical protein
VYRIHCQFATDCPSLPAPFDLARSRQNGLAVRPDALNATDWLLMERVGTKGAHVVALGEVTDAGRGGLYQLYHCLSVCGWSHGRRWAVGGEMNEGPAPSCTVSSRSAGKD